MNFRILIFIVIIYFASVDSVVTEHYELNRDFLIPENTRITNNISSGRPLPQVERAFSTFMRRWDIKGASVAIAKDGKLVYSQGLGFADGTNRVEPYHRFRIASISKLITAVAVLKLCEDGIIDVNDKVFGEDAILNDSIYANPRDKRVYNITIGHLLGHQGGWTPRYGDHMFLTQVIAKSTGVQTPISTSDYVRFAFGKNLHFTPGTGRSYSNLGYAILGLVVEKVSGMSYEDYCRTNIFEPLGIYDIAMGKNLQDQKLVNEVQYFEQSDAIPKLSIYGTGEIVPASYGGNDIESLGAAGGWVATAPDLMKLLLAVDMLEYNPDILSHNTIELMTDESNGLAPLGWKAAMKSGVWWRTGSFPGTTAMMKRLPEGISWVVLFNSSSWNGPELTSDINGLMSRVVSQVKEWPEEDLFKYSLPVPLKEYINY
jgi:CubicO group peptidase (beta-lactamase class C family)